ncbi:MAG: Rrf2 family transcriptional regulator [Eubacteriales bacterium]
METVRGAQGGYELTGQPSELTVQRVLTLLEGSTAIVDCVGTKLHECDSACTCSARPLFCGCRRASTMCWSKRPYERWRMIMCNKERVESLIRTFANN